MKNKNLIIALYADSYDEKTGMRNTYLGYFSQFGHVMLVHCGMDLDFVLEHCDVLALPGGADVLASRYKERPSIWAGRPNQQYEYLDEQLLKPWILTGKPIIGICRGLQTLNVALGGSLHQHIIGHIGDDEARDAPHHELYTDITGYEVVEVNSFHHQAIKTLAPGLKVIGWSTAYKRCPSLDASEFAARRYTLSEKQNRVLKSNQEFFAFPEIITHETLPYIAFQYHPEESNCPLAKELITQTLKEYELQPSAEEKKVD